MLRSAANHSARRGNFGAAVFCRRLGRLNLTLCLMMFLYTVIMIIRNIIIN